MGKKSWGKKVGKKLEKKLEKVGKKLEKSWKKVGKKLKKKKVGRYVFFGQIMSLHHSDQMSQRLQVSRIALCMSKVKVSESVS